MTESSSTTNSNIRLVQVAGVKTAANSSYSSVLLHPLVILNISDHATRARLALQREHSQIPILACGVFLGVQTDRRVELFTSYELAMDESTGNHLFSRDYFLGKQLQIKEVFPTYDILGWYSVGTGVTQAELIVHQQMLEFNESPLYLQLDINALNATELPIKIYETSVDVSSDPPTVFLSPVAYKIEASDGEKIGVDHIASSLDRDTGSKSIVDQLLSKQFNAIEMLQKRLNVAVKFLQAVQQNQIQPPPMELLRNIGSLCSQLPAYAAETSFNDEHTRLTNDVMLTTYLATLTTGCNAAQSLVSKFNVLHERRGGNKSEMSRFDF